jgi:hypothetical protein
MIGSIGEIMIYKIDELETCEDCHTYIVGDMTAFDYYNITEERISEIEESFKKFLEGPGELTYVMVGEEDFSLYHCEICESPLVGKRYIYEVYCSSPRMMMKC